MLLSPWFVDWFELFFHSYSAASSGFLNKMWLYCLDQEMHTFVWLCLLCWTSPEQVGWTESHHCSWPLYDHVCSETSALLTDGSLGCLGSVLLALTFWLMYRTLGQFWLHTLQVKRLSQSLLLCPLHRQPKQTPVSFRKFILSLHFLLQSWTLLQWVTLRATHTNTCVLCNWNTWP